MKPRVTYILLMMLTLPGLSFAQMHRIGIGLGTTAGIYQEDNMEIDLAGELVELPIYNYISDLGFTVGLKLMEFSTRGTFENTISKKQVSYHQSLLAIMAGFEIQLGDNFAVAPKAVKSYLGNSRFQYSDYAYFTSNNIKTEYVTGTKSISGKAELSGFEVPLYYKGEYYYIGLKFGTYANNTQIQLSSNIVSEVKIISGLQFILEAIF